MERNRYWDVIKGLGIIAVVLGHAGIQGYFVSSFDLALFFFVAGHFYNDKYTADIFSYFGKKLERLWWPTFKYTAFFILFHNVFVFFRFTEGAAPHGNYLPGEYIDGYEILRRGFLAFWGQHLEVLGGPLWFIFPLFVGLLFFSIVRNIRIRLPIKIAAFGEFLLITALYLLGIFIIEKHIVVPFWSESALLMIPIVYFGFISRNYIKKLIPKNTILLFLGVLFSVGILQYCINHQIIIIFSEKRYHDPILFLVVTLIGIYMNLLLAELICKVNVLTKLFSYIGEKSFHIMALHFLCFKMINLVYILAHNMSYSFMPKVVITEKWWPLYVSAGVGMPLFFIYIYEYCKSTFFVKRTHYEH